MRPYEFQLFGMTTLPKWSRPSQTSYIAVLMTSHVLLLVLCLMWFYLRGSKHALYVLSLKRPAGYFCSFLIFPCDPAGATTCSDVEMIPYFYLSSATEQMDQVSNRSGVASDDITDETTSLVDVRWSSDEEVKHYTITINIKVLLLEHFAFI